MKKFTLSCAISSFFMLLSGCGTADYEARLNAAASGASAGSKFSTVLNPATPLPDAAISIGVPKVMTAADVNDPIRGKCPVLESVGLKATYEGSVGESWRYFLHVCVTEMPANGILPTRTWLNNLISQNPNAADSSTEINKKFSVETPQGASVDWEEMHFRCKQPFFYPTADKPQNVLNTEGVLVCLCRQEGNKCIALLYRYPVELADRHSTDFDPEWIKLIAGTVKADGAN